MNKYYNKQTNSWYIEGRTLTIHTPNGSLFSGIPTEEQLKEWGYELYEEPKPEPLSEEAQTALDRSNRMQSILRELSSMDYLTSKYIDGEDMTPYGDWQEKRKELRLEYNILEEEQNAYYASLTEQIDN